MKITQLKWLVLLALCGCTQGLSAVAQDLSSVDTRQASEARLLRAQDKTPAASIGISDPPQNPTDDEKATGNRAIHRVYDPVTGLYCELVGDCHVCPVSEKDEVYCRDTGHRQELSCPKASATGTGTDAPKEMRFSSCTPIEKASPVVRVITFEVIMAGLLAGAYTLLQKERRKHRSAFDVRKEAKQQRGALLGDKNHD